ALNCADNSNYDTLRNTLETTTCVGSSTDPRCGFLVANVCGEGTDVGSNPFNADYCFAGGDNTIFATQRKAVVDGCAGVTTATETCTQEIIDCIANPFATSGITTGANTVACDDASVSAAFVAPTITYCGTGSTDNGAGLTANISQVKCQTFATTLATSNPCVRNPFDVGCNNDSLGGADDALTTARSLRTTYCSGLGTTSLAIRTDGSDGYCRGAVNNFCTGDNLFASTSGAEMFDCLTDGTYDGDRGTQYQLCNGDMASRANMDCDTTAVAICTNATIAEADPFAPICTETTTLDATEVKTARQAIIGVCAALSDRTTNTRCGRSVSDSTPNNNVAEILATCDGESRNAACDDYASAGQFYANDRMMRYASGCAGASPDDPALCPVEPVQMAICTDRQGANPRPFAAICTMGTPVSGIAGIRLGVLNYCLNDSLNSGICATGDGLAGASITSAFNLCGSAEATANPFNPAAAIDGFTGTVDCEDIPKYLTMRNTFRNSCRDAVAGSSSLFTSSTCSEVVADICTATSGVNANPFSNICSATTHSGQRATFATSCVGATAPLGNGATCPAAVIECANNPFGSTCVLTGTTTVDPASTAQRTAVLGLCDCAEKFIA
ncbi:MAG: hypothetical protein K8953_03960, partial [Proteobacteria bacterium]|nr:hypothetical protein [Pseudomonadota bacterium]